ncbi:unnamed protein product [Aphanomyces euteiches]
MAVVDSKTVDTSCATYCLEAKAPTPTTPIPPTLVHLFQSTVDKFPHAIDVSCARGTPSDPTALDTLTYTQLQATVQRMAATLQDTPQSSVIGILLNKSLDLTLAILATTFAGATWLPFDPDAPLDRVAVCLQDAQASALIFDDAHISIASQALQNLPSCKGILFSTLKAACPAAELPILRAPSPDTPAYYIYTSGTTGTPKGISISHRAAAAFAISESSVLKLTERDVVWNGFSPAFDMWVEETWCAHLAIAVGGQWQDIASLCSAWETRRVTVIMAVPTLMAMVCSEGAVPNCVRLINMGGEACPPALVARLSRPHLELFNTYGPSETTVTATYSIVAPDKPITIGTPLPFYHALILKETESTAAADDEVIPLRIEPGIVGELAIGGPCVGQGYVGRPDLTRVKFVPHPTRHGETIYRSGDLVSLNGDGDIVFIGRIDTQVKYRGFRIELGEIEEKLSAITGVLAAAVILAKGSDVHDSLPDRLEAYIVMEPGLAMDTSALRKQLAAVLMAYMLPDVFVQLGEHAMPRLLSGKIDKKGLTAMSKAKRAVEAMEMSTATAAAERNVESTASITAESDIFDDLGAHSLLAATLASHLRRGHVNFADNPFQFIGLADVYALRTPQRLALKFSTSVEDNMGRERPFHAVSTLRYVMCDVGQALCLVVLLGLYGMLTLAPFVASNIVYARTSSLIGSLVATYAMFVIGPLYAAAMPPSAMQPGDHPVFGWFYLRWWFVTRLNELVDKTLWADSYLMVLWLQLLGAKVGNHVHVGAIVATPCLDLITIGDGVSIGREVLLACDVVDQGLLKLRRISIDRHAFISTSVTLEVDVHVQEGAEVMSMSGLHEGVTVPACQVWAGSPAAFQAAASACKLPSPPSPCRLFVMFLAQGFIVVWFMPLLHLIPMIPMAVWTRSIASEAAPLSNAIPFAFASGAFYVVAVAVLLVATKYIVVGKIRPGEYSTCSFFFLRKWLFDGMMQISLRTLHTVYATLYVVPFLRVLGAKIGVRSEVLTANHVVLDLLQLGDECFVADWVLLGDDHIREYTLTLKQTTMGKRSFVGNGSLIPQGTTLASNTLVGVFSTPPEKTPLQEGESCFGLPAILMPTRRNVTDAYDTSLLFYPSWPLYGTRLVIEGIRIIFAPLLVSLGVWFALLWIVRTHTYHDDVHLDIAATVGNLIALSPVYYVSCFVVPTIAVPALIKWLFLGQYQPVEWPMWSVAVWRSEFIMSVLEHLTSVGLLPFVGTPFLPMIYRLFGAKIGRRCYMGGVDIPEFDCIHVGDDCAFNPRGFAQTHLFEDRVMKLGHVRIGNRCTLRMRSILLPESRMEDDTALGCNSVVMKGETLTRGYEWRGFPVDIAGNAAPDDVSRDEPRGRASSKLVMTMPGYEVDVPFQNVSP